MPCETYKCLVSHSYKILRDVGRIRNYLSTEQLLKIVHAVISSRLDYCNSLFMNLPKDEIFKLQKLQNSAAKLVLGMRKRDSATLALTKLHWLNVKSRVAFKVILLVFKMLTGKCPPTVELRYKETSERSSDLLLLETKMFHSKYGKRLFQYNGPRLWNALPVEIRMTTNIETFKSSLKTYLFSNYDLLMRNVNKYYT